nr:protein 95 [synthetic construct]
MDDCQCHTWYNSYGTQSENDAEQYVSWFIFGITSLNLLYYIWNIFRATAGWEEIFVCIIEGFAAAVSAWPQLSNPYTIYLSTGQRVQWIRYFEWLMTCPVILIHLSNLTGMKHHYPLRTMTLIVSDISCIVTGVQCALSNGYAKIIWFLVSCAFGLVTYFSAFKTYKEAYALVPDLISKRIVLTMATIFFVSWTGYPLLFALGPEGFQQISYYAMNIGYCLNDMFSKNIWGLLGHTLRIRAFNNSKDGWVVPRSSSSVGGSGKDMTADQQVWVAG